MKFDLSKEKGQQLGSREFLVKEGKGMKLLLFIGSLCASGWLSYSQVILRERWVYGLFRAEIPPVVVILLSLVLLLIGLYPFIFMGGKSKLEIYNYGLRLNDSEIFYSDITAVAIKKRFFVKVMVTTADNQYVYQATKLSLREQKAINEVRTFIYGHERRVNR